MSRGLYLNLDDFDDFADSMDETIDDFQEALHDGYEELGEELRDSIVENGPRRRTGQWASSWRVKVSGVGEKVKAAVKNPLVYAPVLEFAKRGKWQGLVEKYGPPPRFAYETLDRVKDSLIERVTERLIDRVKDNRYLG